MKTYKLKILCTVLAVAVMITLCCTQTAFASEKKDPFTVKDDTTYTLMLPSTVLGVRDDYRHQYVMKCDVVSRDTITLPDGRVTRGQCEQYCLRISEQPYYIDMSNYDYDDTVDVYCIQLGVGIDGKSCVKVNNDLGKTAYANFSEDQIKALGLVMYYGLPGQGLWSSESNETAHQYATQCLVWEIVENFRNPVTYELKDSRLYNSVVEKYPELKRLYDDIVVRLKKHNNMPSFTSTELNKAQSYTMNYNSANNRYEISLTDVNGILSDELCYYQFDNAQIGYEINGNNILIYSNDPISDEISVAFAKNMNEPVNKRDLKVFSNYYNDDEHGNNKLQNFIYWCPSPSPISGYMKLKTETGKLEMAKASDDMSSIGGCHFRIYNQTDSWYGISDNYGRIYQTNSAFDEPSESNYIFTNLLDGNYTVEEFERSDDIFLESCVITVKNVDGDVISQKTYKFNDGIRYDNGVYRIENVEVTGITQGGTINVDFKNAHKSRLRIHKIVPSIENPQFKLPEVGASFQIYLKSKDSYANCPDDMRDIMICDAYGDGVSKYLPYGIYTVHQTSSWHGYKTVDDFDIVLSSKEIEVKLTIENNPEDFKIRILKTDGETQKLITRANAIFKIYDPNGNVIKMTQQQIDEFKTDENGFLILPEKLPIGKNYSIEEIKPPYGYTLAKERVYFDVTEETAKINEQGEMTIDVVFCNDFQNIEITINKIGEAFTGYKIVNGMYKPQYTFVVLEGAEFQIIAAENIITGDNVVRYKKGEVIEVVTTDKNGVAKSTKKLYYGKYKIKEIKAPYGYVINKEEVDIELPEYDPNITTYKVNVDFKNEKQKVKITVKKVFEKDEGQPSDDDKYAKFALYAEDDIKGYNGVVIPKGSKLCELICKNNEEKSFDIDLPVGAKVYFKEIATSEGYTLDNKKYSVTFNYDGQETEVYNKPTEVIQNYKTHLTGDYNDIYSVMILALLSFVAIITLKSFSKRKCQQNSKI